MLLATTVPGSVVPPQFSPYDKVAHFTLYALFAVLLSRDIAQVTGRWRSALLAILIAVAFGAADEWHQQFIPGRSTDIADWRADSIGAAIGAVLFTVLSWIRRTRTTTTTK